MYNEIKKQSDETQCITTTTNNNNRYPSNKNICIKIFVLLRYTKALRKNTVKTFDE